MRYVWIGAAVALWLAGCGVSQQVVDQQQEDLDACRAAVAAVEQGATTDRSAAKEQRTSLQTELQRCRGEADAAAGERDVCAAARKQADVALAALRGEVERTQLDAVELRQREAELRRQLEQELTQKTVEIEELQGRLAVRVLDRLLFDSGSADISGLGAKVLAKLGPVLARGKEIIRVEGHTDDLPVGPALKPQYFSNWELGAARAAAVVRYFQYGQGIDPARLEAVGLGGYRPLEPNATSKARQRNRRVEIVLLPGR